MKYPRTRPVGKTSAEELLDEAAKLSLSRDQLGRLRYCMTIHLGTKGDRRRSDELVARIRREISAGVEETVALERARGEEVADFNTAGAKRLGSRDGLLSLFRAGKVNAEQAGAGLGYRKAREAAFSMGTGKIREKVCGGGALDAAGLWLARAKLAVAAAKVDRLVALELKDRPDALDTLRRVAGDGQSVRSLVNGSRGFDHRVDGLVRALDIARRFVALDPT